MRKHGAGGGRGGGIFHYKLSQRFSFFSRFLSCVSVSGAVPFVKSTLGQEYPQDFAELKNVAMLQIRDCSSEVARHLASLDDFGWPYAVGISKLSVVITPPSLDHDFMLRGSRIRSCWAFCVCKELPSFFVHLAYVCNCYFLFALDDQRQ